MADTAEVVIIGGGVVGASIAYHLAKRGCQDILLVEKDSLASGSTGKGAGGMRQQFSSEINILLSIQSLAFFRRFEEETGYSADLRQYGYLILATTEEEWQAFQHNVALQRKLGVEVHLFSPQQVREMIPSLNVEDLKGATFCPTDGYADPYAVTQAFAAAARRLGTRIEEGREVTGVKIKAGKVRGVMTNRGDIDAPVVINATGPYAALTGRMAGLELPVQPSRRHIFVTAPTDALGREVPLVIDFHTGFWFRREGASLVFGMRNPLEPPSFNTSVDWGFLPTLAQKAAHRLPLLSEAGIMRAWAGLHEDTPDYHALLGEDEEVKGFYYAVGFSGHGFMHSPATGSLMAELVLGGKTSLDISSLSLRRFQQPGQLQPEGNFI